MASSFGVGSSHSHSSSGEIHLFVGPMFAGKTTSLLRRIKSEVDNGRYSSFSPRFFFLLVISFLCDFDEMLWLLGWSIFLIVNYHNFLWRNVAMLKSSKDNRYAVDSVVTHDGIKFPCWALPDLMLFKDKYGHEAYQKVISMFYQSYTDFLAVLICLTV